MAKYPEWFNYAIDSFTLKGRLNLNDRINEALEYHGVDAEAIVSMVDHGETITIFFRKKCLYKE